MESSLGRVPQAADGTCNKNRKPDRVGRRGLSEPREDFSRLTTNHTARRFCPSIWRNHAVQIPWCGSTVQIPRFEFCRAFACVPSRWKVLSGEFRRRPTALVKKFASWIVSVAEDCLSPERTFHGCLQITPLDASACRFVAIMLLKFRGAVL